MSTIPLPLRSAADRVALSRDVLVHLLGSAPLPPEATSREAMERYGANTAAYQTWTVWRAAELFTREWQAFLAEQMPAQGQRATTMDVGAAAVPVAAVEPERIACQ
jgi:hypothetical protein